MKPFNGIELSQQLNETELRICIKKALDGSDECRKKAIESNLRLVPFVIEHEFTHLSIPLEDAISEGNIALINAVDNFDINSENSFAVYAARAIVHRVYRATELYSYDFIVRVPYRKRVNYGNTISISELEKDSSFDIEDVSDENTSIGKNIKQMKNVLIENIDKLEKNEKKVIIESFGLNGEEVKTLKAIGKELNLSKQRIKQIKTKSLKKLKNSMISGKCEYFY